MLANRFIPKTLFVSTLILVLVLTGCAQPTAPITTETTEPEPTLTVTPAATQEPIPDTPSPPTSLRLWVPPEFDPGNGTRAGRLLQARLDEFTERRGVNIEVRVKALNGSGGMVDSLSAANAAAPLALPDLSLLPHDLLEDAALKGLLTPLDGMIEPLEESDWYEYARQLAAVQNSTYGLPFAGDALLLLYRPAAVAEPPRDWVSTMEITSTLIFPAAEEQASFTLAQYLISGGKLQDDEGRPMLEAETLTQVLTFFQEANTTGLMPAWLTELTSDDQALTAYDENRGDMVVTWASRYLNELPVDTAAESIPTPTGSLDTLAHGWVWAISNPQVQRHPLSIELAEFLTSSDFLTRWSPAAGLLPPRSSALPGWFDTTTRNLIGRTVLSADIVSPTDVLTVISPALKQATIDVLNNMVDPQTAAQTAVNQVSGQ
jgi:ABC-type glycerol-3-phosphate transport system substrate-binding protein